MRLDMCVQEWVRTTHHKRSTVGWAEYLLASQGVSVGHAVKGSRVA